MSEHRRDASDRAVVEIPDEVLAEHLSRRASRPVPRALAASIVALVDQTVPERRWRLAVAAWRPRLAVAGSGLALVLVVALLAINAMPGPVGTDRGSPSPSGGQAATGPVWDPTIRALTPPELMRILASHPAKGTTLIVDDQIVGVLVSCASSDDCPEGRLVNAGIPVTAPPGGHLPFDNGSTIPGPLALQVGSGPNLVFLGGVVSNGTRLEFTARDLAQRNAMGGLFVIPGWIHRGPVVPCPSIVAPRVPLPTSELGLPAPEIAWCSGGVYLTDSNPGPPPYGIGGGDPNALPVQQEAYQQYASNPADGTASRGVFLVRDWAGYGEVLAGLQPIGIPPVDTAQATAAPTLGSVWNAMERPLAPAEMARILATNPPVGTVLIVDDQIVPSTLPCSEMDCPSGRLGSDYFVGVIAPAGGRLPFPLVAGTAQAIRGPVALRVDTGPNLVYLGLVRSNGPAMAFTATDVARAGTLNALHVIDGWLWKTGPVPCPSFTTTPPPAPRSELGIPEPNTDICAGATYLTDGAPRLPITGSPSDGFEVQNDAYQDFPPVPDSIGTPGLAVYLVRDWGNYGEVVARLQAIEIPAPSSAGPGPSGEPTTPASPASRVLPVDAFVGRVLDGSLPAGSIVVADIPTTAVTVLSPTAAGGPENPNQSRWAITAGAGWIRVDGIAKDAITGTQAFLVEPSDVVRALGPVTADGTASKGLFIAHGWLRNGPPLRCLIPTRQTTPGLLGEPLTWSQCAATWILPTAADPWPTPTDYAKGDASMPPGTLHVQDNALGTYIEASEGFWLVRLAASNPCPPGYFCTLTLADKPAPGVSWYELVGLVASPAPDAVEPRPPATAAP